MVSPLLENLPIILDGRPVEQITAFLFPKGGHENPKVLLANAEKSFVGSYVLGMGFTFDDTSEEVTPIAEMERLIAENPKNQERIFPYIGGSEVNTSPTHSHHRYVINFGELSEEEARQWPDLMAIVEEKVKPERDNLNMNTADGRRRAANWWLWGRYTPALFRAIAQCDRVLVISRVTQHFSFTFLPSGMVYSERLVIFPEARITFFNILQSRIHEIWTRFFTTTHEDRLTYFPSDCFETFPFPKNWESDPTLETIGQTYYQFRADLMVRNNEGLTDTYNRFHAPQETDPNLLQLRDLHGQMDQAVLDAYGWPDIDTPCGFALDYLDIDADKLPPQAQERITSGDLYFPTAPEAAAFDNLVQSALKKRKKLPWRYRWPESTHDEVLARLLDLNQKRYEEEVIAGLHSKKKKPTKRKSTKKKAAPSKKDSTPTIPGMEI